MKDVVQYWLSDLVSSLWLPVIFILGAGAVLIRIYRRSDKKHSQEMAGIALGVILGFVSQVTVGSFDEFRKEQQFKKASALLLQHDAENIYRNMRLFEELLKIKSPATAGIDRAIPPRIDMLYWDELKKDHNFLLLARDDRFAKIFQGFWELEDINHLIDRGHAGDKEARMAITIYHEALKQQAHRELLSQFLTAEQIEELDRKYKDRMTAQR